MFPHWDQNNSMTSCAPTPQGVNVGVDILFTGQMAFMLSNRHFAQTSSLITVKNESAVVTLHTGSRPNSYGTRLKILVSFALSVMSLLTFKVSSLYNHTHINFTVLFTYAQLAMNSEKLFVVKCYVKNNVNCFK